MISISTLNNEDIEELSRLAKMVWHECFINIISYDQIEYMTDLFLSPEAIKDNIEHAYIYRIIKEDDTMIGFTASKPEEKKIFLSKLYLLDTYRGRGLGKMMVEDVINLYDKDEIYLTVNKYNRAVDLYKHLGFEIIDSVVNDIGNNYVMDDYIMSKRIDRS